MQKPGELKKPQQPGTLRKDAAPTPRMACALCGTTVYGEHEAYCPLSIENARRATMATARAGTLQKDLKELCSCPGVCLIHGVAKFRPPAKPAAQGEVTVEQLEENRRSQGRGK
jgi:hypothetical protein